VGLFFEKKIDKREALDKIEPVNVNHMERKELKKTKKILPAE
jgi:hypothetical protein